MDVTAVRRAVWSPHAPVLLDVRWALGRSDGRESYLAGHLPGAVFVDLETELAAPASPALGRHPLPTTATLQEAARRWGITAQRDVVVYDDAGGTSAARAWWLLRAAGVRRVSILDGGLRAWVAAGEHLEEGAVRPRPGDITLEDPAAGAHLAVVDADGAAALAASADGVLLDARAGERFRGEVEPVDPRAGHIPGAVSAPTTENLTGDGHLRADLRDRFAALGVVAQAHDAAAEVAVYCGSGVTASHTVAVLASLGIDAALYPGSFSQWSNDPDREVAAGPA
nr:sulfurtransferase [Serinibacter salmoneus]